MPSMKDLTGKRFGMLTAIRPTEKRSRSGDVIYECICDCGNTHLVTFHNLKSRNTKSCGCNKLSWKHTSNKKIRSDNTSGVTGVSWNKQNSKWKVEINVNCRKIYLGYFDKLEDAVAVRKIAEAKYYNKGDE